MPKTLTIVKFQAKFRAETVHRFRVTILTRDIRTPNSRPTAMLEQSEELGFVAWVWAPSTVTTSRAITLPAHFSTSLKVIPLVTSSSRNGQVAIVV